MKFVSITTIFAAMLLFSAAAFGQKPAKAPDYSIEALKVNAFDEARGTTKDAIPENGEPMSFFNDLSTSLFVWVVIKGEVGSFEAGRMVSVSATSGKKVLAVRNNVQVGLIGEEGLYRVPLFVYGPLCTDVTITARLSGQRKISTRKVRIPFICGE